jgi:hypothetical protein
MDGGTGRKKCRRRSDFELCSISPGISDAGPRDLVFEVGSDAWGLNPLGDPREGLTLYGESAARC